MNKKWGIGTTLNSEFICTFLSSLGKVSNEVNFKCNWNRIQSSQDASSQSFSHRDFSIIISHQPELLLRERTWKPFIVVGVDAFLLFSTDFLVHTTISSPPEYIVIVPGSLRSWFLTLYECKRKRLKKRGLHRLDCCRKEIKEEWMSERKKEMETKHKDRKPLASSTVSPDE